MQTTTPSITTKRLNSLIIYIYIKNALMTTCLILLISVLDAMQQRVNTADDYSRICRKVAFLYNWYRFFNNCTAKLHGKMI